MREGVKSFFVGLKTSVPVMIGFIPVAIAFAMMATSAGLDGFESVAMSVMVYAGASQMMAVGMIAEGAGYLAIVVATFIMNFRHFIMSTCVFERMERNGKKTGLAMKLFCSFGVTDESFAIFTTSDTKKCDKWYFTGVFLGPYLSWILGTLVGVLLGAVLPEIVSSSLGIALYAMFIALLVPNVKGNVRLLAVVFITAVINLLLRFVIDANWALIASTLIGAAIGVFIVKDEDDTSENADIAETEVGA
jgi:4-azaleucine resistance transporter AzlC